MKSEIIIVKAIACVARIDHPTRDMWLISGVWIIWCCLWMCEGLNFDFVWKGRMFFLCGSYIAFYIDDHYTVAALLP